MSERQLTIVCLATICFFLLITLISSCVPYKSLQNYNNPPPYIDSLLGVSNFNPIVIQPDDILDIQISSSDPLAIQPFLLGASSATGSSDASGGQSTSAGGYLVDSAGEVNLPTLGKIPLGGLTTPQANERLVNLLNPYFEDVPIINIRISNFKISVSGEVNSPGIFSIAEERVTIVEALVMAGDLSDYSQRDSILVVREAGNNRTFNWVSIQSSDIFNSPYFYLHQNDVLYVRPHKSKRGSIRPPASNILPWVSAITSIVALVIALSR